MNLKRRTLTIPNNLGFILLSVWLIALGLAHLLGLSSVFLSMALNILAISAGVLLLLERR